MANDYKSSNIEIVGREGMMYNEATEKTKRVNYPHYGIFANTNTYAVTFNPMVNRPPTLMRENRPVRPPPSNEHITKITAEPPVFMTDGRHYMHYVKPQKTPLLPPYLQKPEPLGQIQGRAQEKNKADIIYGPRHQVHITNNVY